MRQTDRIVRYRKGRKKMEFDDNVDADVDVEVGASLVVGFVFVYESFF